MTDQTTPAAAAVTPAPSQSSTTETTTTPAPEAAIQEQTTQPPAAKMQAPPGTPEPQEGKSEGTGEDESKKANKVSAKERISQITAQRNEWQMRAQAAEAELNRLKEPLQQPGPDATQDEVDRYNVKAAVREQRAEEVAAEAERAAMLAMAARNAAIQAKAEAVADRAPGLWDQLRALPELSEPTADFIASSDKGAEIGIYLTHNPTEAVRINRLHPYQQGIELARLEARLNVAPTVRKTSTAPPPPPALPGSANPTTPDPSKMDMAAYEAWRKAGGGR